VARQQRPPGGILGSSRSVRAARRSESGNDVEAVLTARSRTDSRAVGWDRREQTERRDTDVIAVGLEQKRCQLRLIRRHLRREEARRRIADARYSRREGADVGDINLRQSAPLGRKENATAIRRPARRGVDGAGGAEGVDQLSV